MTVRFTLALAYLLTDEGLRYSDDPDDAGGPTKFGVTLQTYRTFLGRDVTLDEMASLTLEDIRPVYQSLYWDPLHGDDLLRVNQAIALFDTAVLYGLESTVIVAQKALNQSGLLLKVDGDMGPKTITALNQVDRAAWFEAFYLFILHRINDIIRDNPQDEKYRNGWTARAHRLSLTLNTDTSFELTKPS